MIARIKAETAYIGIGSNLAEPRQQVQSAFAALDCEPGCRVIARSSLYQSAPLGPQDQPDYINAIAAVQSTQTPHMLLDTLQGIEQAQGRQRDGTRWGPRTLDLDLLLYGPLKLLTQRLTLPHPEMTARAFVLWPLAEIAPDLHIPGLGPITDFVARTDAGDLQRLDAGA